MPPAKTLPPLHRPHHNPTLLQIQLPMSPRQPGDTIHARIPGILLQLEALSLLPGRHNAAQLGQDGGVSDCLAAWTSERGAESTDELDARRRQEFAGRESEDGYG